MEILITVLILLTAVWILYKNITKKSKGCTDCSECANKCKDEQLKIK